MNVKTAGLVCTALLLGSCQTWGPTWSEVTGRIYTLPAPGPNIAPTIVQNIDGNGAFPDGPLMPIKVTPGKHTIVLAAAPLTAWPGGTDLETITIEIAPCKRVYINGQYDTKLSMSWKPYIGYEEAISGCTVPATK